MKRAYPRPLTAVICLATATAAPSQRDPVSSALEWVDRHQSRITRVSDQIGEFAEPGMLEVRTADLLARELRAEGFAVQLGAGGMPTALAATWGRGRPVIGVLTDLDAVAAEPPRHACGHNLMTGAALGAALSLQHAMAELGLPGTVRFFGAPAEEEYVAKVFMAREGVFDGLDAVLAWHPSGRWAANSDFNALISTKFRFHHAEGRHPGIAPRLRGNPLRSAVELARRVDAARQRLFDEDRATADYVLTRAGEVPTAMPEVAEIWFMLVAPDREKVKALQDRLREMARAVADEAGTRMEEEFLLGTHERLRNDALSEMVHGRLKAFAPKGFSEEELAAARRALAGYPDVPERLYTFDVHMNDRSSGGADRGEVSWLAPMTHVHSHSWPAGAPRHSRVQAAIARSSIGHKTMLAVCRTLAAVGAELLTDPQALARVRREFEQRTAGYRYKALLPEGARPPTAEELWAHTRFIKASGHP